MCNVCHLPQLHPPPHESVPEKGKSRFCSQQHTTAKREVFQEGDRLSQKTPGSKRIRPLLVTYLSWWRMRPTVLPVRPSSPRPREGIDLPVGNVGNAETVRLVFPVISATPLSPPKKEVITDHPQKHELSWTGRGGPFPCFGQE